MIYLQCRSASKGVRAGGNDDKMLLQFSFVLWWQVNWFQIICITKLKSSAADVPY